LVGLSAIYISGYVAMGLIVASYCSNQQQAMLLSFFVIFPNLMITGCFFPADDMPWPIEWLSRLLPIRYYLVLLRTILLKGGSGLLPEPLAWLVGLSLLYVLWAVVRFRRLPSS
ncbi:ABC transporter permease, partial [Armatimonas sp.]|uniref:ABC transporter permease n=1 Tax=Armatimonas sp. TaxID=1872638 RepID=UPI00374CF469